MQPDVDFFLIGQFLRFSLRAHTEADDDCVRRRRQQHVRFRDRAHAGVQQLEPHFVVAEFPEQVAQHFHRALHVGLQDDIQFLHPSRL